MNRNAKTKKKPPKVKPIKAWFWVDRNGYVFFGTGAQTKRDLLATEPHLATECYLRRLLISEPPRKATR